MSADKPSRPAGLRQYPEAIAEVCAESEFSIELVNELLDLEPVYRNLHGWGAKSRLRKAIQAVLDKHLPTP